MSQTNAMDGPCLYPDLNKPAINDIWDTEKF